MTLKVTKGSKQVTLKDVAKKLGVSTATVSLSINDNPLVAQKTREKVLKAIEELGYVYNRRAASLITGESRMVGLAVHDITNPYFTQVCDSIETVMSGQGRMSLLCNSHESIDLQKRFIDALVEHNADGLLLCPVAGTTLDDLKPIIKRGLPTVLLTREIEGAEMDFVGNDEHLSMFMATDHLIKLGHQHIIFLGGNVNASAARKRRKGYFDAMLQSPETSGYVEYVDCENTPESAERIIASIVNAPNPPTAIVGFSDQVALGAISGLLALGKTPGKDIAIVGCDNISESSRAYSQLTTIHIKKSEIGQLAAQLLEQRLQQPDLAIKRTLFEPELIIRKSCGSHLASK